jgi:hypothetical protein
LAVPALRPGDVIVLLGQFEVTNPYPFNLQLDRYIGRGPVTSAMPTAEPLTLITGDNVPPEIHHKRDVVYAVDSGQTGDTTYEIILESASLASVPGDALVLERGYGELVVLVVPAVSI